MCRVPVHEIEKLWTKDHKWSDVTITDGDNLLSGVKNELLDIDATIGLTDADEIGFKLRGQTVAYCVKDQTLTALGRSAKLTPIGNRLSLRILLDRNSVEVYADQGRVVISNCFVPGDDQNIELYTKGGKARIISMHVHELKSAWQQ
jgi:sucrose-6-phosphate hydrolase SacC (GH32 family)